MSLRLSWPAPASEWSEAVPVGNGRLGGMVFGDGRIQLNDAFVWSGTPSGPASALRDVVAAGAGPARLQEVRDAIDAGDYRRAESLLMSFEGPYSQEYLPFADLWMDLGGGDRVLDLHDAVVSEEFSGVRRRTFASRPAGALCVLVESAEPLDVRLRLSSPLRVDSADGDARGLALGLAVPVDGAPLHEPEVASHRYLSPGETVDGYDPFAAVALALDTDGVSSVGEDVASEEVLLRQHHFFGHTVVVQGATRLLVVVTSSAAAGDWWAGVPSRSREEHLADVRRRAAEAVGVGGEALLAAHLDDVRPLLGAASVTIWSLPAAPVDVPSLLKGDDDVLKASVLVQLGRYLLVSASRPGGPPANLQGIWNDQLRPPWSSNYTVNVNTEMNYWGAEPSGLAECHLPLADLLDRMVAQGTEVASALYGTRGWVTHHNTDLWGWSLPVGREHGNPSWAIWMMGGVWLAHHLWEYYEYGLDEDFLRDRAWPVLRGAASFGLDWLQPGPGGVPRTSPSTSPENLFAGPDGSPESLSTSAAMDLALLRDLFTNCLSALEVLKEPDPLADELRAALARLPEGGVTADGLLREWTEDVTAIDPHHRHMSQLVALYPLGQISPGSELAVACGKLLDSRGPGAMGWSWAWKIAARARLGDGGTALELLREATAPLEGDTGRFAPVDGSEWGGLLPNLFSAHPPFQIDGNYGFVAAIIELLVQSPVRGTVRLLPAVPPSWPSGSVRGIRCRGGLSVDLTWSSARLTSGRLTKVAGSAPEPVHILYAGSQADVVLGPGDSYDLTTVLDQT